MTKTPVPLVEDIASFVADRRRLAEDPFVLARDPCSAAADLVFPMDESSSLRHDAFVLAEPRCQHAKAFCLLTEALCWLSEGLLSSIACGCKASEVLRSPARALCTLAKDVWEVSEILAPRTAGFHQKAEDPASSTKGLREEPKDIHRKPDVVSLLAEDLCLYPGVLVQETAFLFRWNKRHWVISKSSASCSKGLSHVSTTLRPESEGLFDERERLGVVGARWPISSLARNAPTPPVG